MATSPQKRGERPRIYREPTALLPQTTTRMVVRSYFNI